MAYDIASCPLKFALDIVDGKWKPLILYYLKQGGRRYSELRREIPDSTDRILTLQLRQLEHDGIIRRTVRPGPPQQVSYALTRQGRTLTPILAEMAHWGERHRKRLGGGATPPPGG